jgi:hypothetical protein
VFTTADGRRIPEAGSLKKCFRGNISGAAALVAANTTRGAAIVAQTIRSRWRGESFDYGQAIEAMALRLESALSSASDPAD